ncbi:MAG: hypothetical protein RLN81_13815 [Balneolaceae bacterium]
MQDTKSLNISVELNSKGYAFLPAFLPDHSTIEVSQLIGTPIQNDKISGVHILTPKRKKDSKPNLYSGNFGHNDFPFHTDMAHWYKPPKYLLLRCINGSEDVFTKVLHSSKILNQIPQNKANMALFKPRKAVNGRLTLLKFKQPNEGSFLLRWDQLFLMPSNDAAEEISNMFEEMSNIDSVNFLLNKPGDTLIIDNFKTFHARSGISKKSTNRIVERTYLNNLNYGS